MLFLRGIPSLSYPSLELHLPRGNVSCPEGVMCWLIAISSSLPRPIYWFFSLLPFALYNGIYTIQLRLSYFLASSVVWPTAITSRKWVRWAKREARLLISIFSITTLPSPCPLPDPHSPDSICGPAGWPLSHGSSSHWPLIMLFPPSFFQAWG